MPGYVGGTVNSFDGANARKLDQTPASMSARRTYRFTEQLDLRDRALQRGADVHVDSAMTCPPMRVAASVAVMALSVGLQSAHCQRPVARDVAQPDDDHLCHGRSRYAAGGHLRSRRGHLPDPPEQQPAVDPHCGRQRRPSRGVRNGRYLQYQLGRHAGAAVPERRDEQDRRAADRLGTGNQANTSQGQITFRLANSWNYVPGLYTQTVVFTLAAP